MLAIVIYIIAALAVIVIGLVTVGRETFAASQLPRPAVYEIDAAVTFVSNILDDRTAARLTPDDVLWILELDARSGLAATDADMAASGTLVLDDTEATRLVMDRVWADRTRRDTIDEQDVAAVIAARGRYLETIGAIGDVATDAPDHAESTGDGAGTGDAEATKPT
ncbi:MAG: hypothetical protein JST73_01955 [Actinobacteria bacterium]|nr:hypothetical protein [Actinomycetota bacterium]